MPEGERKSRPQPAALPTAQIAQLAIQTALARIKHVAGLPPC